MEIILLEDVRNLGQRGEIVRVKPGYGRNYLLPKGAALEATRANKAYFEQQRKKIDARHAKLRSEAAEIAATIASLSVKIAKRVGIRDRSGEASHGTKKLDKRRIDLGGVTGLKSLGDHTVTVDLHPEVVAELIVSVVPEE